MYVSSKLRAPYKGSVPIFLWIFQCFVYLKYVTCMPDMKINVDMYSYILLHCCVCFLSAAIWDLLCLRWGEGFFPLGLTLCLQYFSRHIIENFFHCFVFRQLLTLMQYVVDTFKSHSSNPEDIWKKLSCSVNVSHTSKIQIDVSWSQPQRHKKLNRYSILIFWRFSKHRNNKQRKSRWWLPLSLLSGNASCDNVTKGKLLLPL